MLSLTKLTYPSPNIKDHTLDEQELSRKCPLDVGNHRLQPIFDLGRVEKLPYELMADILAQLDLQSLFAFRRVSQRAMQVVDGVPQFKQIVKHHLNVIRAAIAIQAGSYISCVDLLRAMRTRNCETCGDFAGYISLLSCSRVCFLCFTEKVEYLPLTASQVKQNFGINKTILPGVRNIRSIPGRYSPNNKLRPVRMVMYDYDAARRAGIALHGSRDAMAQFISDTFSWRMDQYETRAGNYDNGVPGPKARRPVRTSENHDGLSSNPFRFMAVVRASWISSPTSEPVQGFHCTGCKREYRTRPLHWRRKYTEDTFKKHIEQCGLLRDGRHDAPA